MKRTAASLLALLISCALAACGGGASGGGDAGGAAPQGESSGGADVSAGTSEETTEPAEASGPVGYFKIGYVSDENGNRLEDYDTIEWDVGSRKYTFTTAEFLNFMQVPAYLQFNEDGTGVQYGSEQPVSFTVDGTNVVFDDGRTVEFIWDGDRLLLHEQQASWTAYERTTEATVALMREGKGGSMPLSEAHVGDLVCLGTYEIVPNNDVTEPIYWRVIDEQDGRLLVISDVLLDSFSYDYDPTGENVADVTWENCSLREFLNSEFIDAVFTPEEAALIQTTHISNADSNAWLEQYWNFDQEPYSALATQDHSSGPDTDDRIFLLSLDEVLRYFGEPTEPAGDIEYPFSELEVNPDLIATVSYAVVENGQGYFEQTTLGGAWMTRTLSKGTGTQSIYCVTYITGTGQVFNYLTNVPLFIRPAMWIEVPAG